jgi:hypothetical protein
MGDFYFNPEKSTTSTEKVEKLKTPSESASGTQVASISDDNKRNIEPWAGIWKVEGSRYYNGTWVLKQNGNTVVSTSDSWYKIVGRVDGNSFKGKFSNSNYKFELKLSSDGLSFKGIATDYLGRSGIFIKGRRKE